MLLIFVAFSGDRSDKKKPNTSVLLLLLVTGLYLKGMQVRRDELTLINDLQHRIRCRKVLNISTKSGDSMQM